MATDYPRHKPASLYGISEHPKITQTYPKKLFNAVSTFFRQTLIQFSKRQITKFFKKLPMVSSIFSLICDIINTIKLIPSLIKDIFLLSLKWTNVHILLTTRLFVSLIAHKSFALFTSPDLRLLITAIIQMIFVYRSFNILGNLAAMIKFEAYRTQAWFTGGGCFTKDTSRDYINELIKNNCYTEYSSKTGEPAMFCKDPYNTYNNIIPLETYMERYTSNILNAPFNYTFYMTADAIYNQCAGPFLPLIGGSVSDKTMYSLCTAALTYDQIWIRKFGVIASNTARFHVPFDSSWTLGTDGILNIPTISKTPDIFTSTKLSDVASLNFDLPTLKRLNFLSSIQNKIKDIKSISDFFKIITATPILDTPRKQAQLHQYTKLPLFSVALSTITGIDSYSQITGLYITYLSQLSEALDSNEYNAADIAHYILNQNTFDIAISLKDKSEIFTSIRSLSDVLHGNKITAASTYETACTAFKDLSGINDYIDKIKSAVSTTLTDLIGHKFLNPDVLDPKTALHQDYIRHLNNATSKDLATIGLLGNLHEEYHKVTTGQSSAETDLYGLLDFFRQKKKLMGDISTPMPEDLRLGYALFLLQVAPDFAKTFPKEFRSLADAFIDNQSKGALQGFISGLTYNVASAAVYFPDSLLNLGIGKGTNIFANIVDTTASGLSGSLNYFRWFNAVTKGLSTDPITHKVDTLGSYNSPVTWFIMRHIQEGSLTIGTAANSAVYDLLSSTARFMGSFVGYEPAANPTQLLESKNPIIKKCAELYIKDCINLQDTNSKDHMFLRQFISCQKPDIIENSHIQTCPVYFNNTRISDIPIAANADNTTLLKAVMNDINQNPAKYNQLPAFIRDFFSMKNETSVSLNN